MLVSDLVEKIHENKRIIGGILDYINKQNVSKEYNFIIWELQKVQGFLAYLEKEAKAMLDDKDVEAFM